MNLLLYRKVILESKLSPEKAVKKLIENTETGKFSRAPGAHKYFHGYVDNDFFLLSRIIRRKNVFIPFIKGKLCEKNKKTQLTLTISPNLFLLAFITLLFLLMIAIIVIPLIKYNLDPNFTLNLTPPYKTLSVIIAFYLFFIITGTVIFNIETNKTLLFLNKILQLN